MKKKVNEWINSYQSFTKKAYSPYEDKGIRKTGAFICNILFSVYLSAIVVFHNFAIFEPRLSIAVICGLVLFVFIYQIFKLLLVKHGEIFISFSKERLRLSWKVFVISSLIIFVVYMINFLAHYPGGVSDDNIWQWAQVQSGNFDNWHPVIHTMIIWLVTRIVPRYAFFLAFQIFCFSLLSGYMAATLKAWGIKAGWMIAFIITILSTNTTRDIFLYAWKDTAFTVLLLCLAIYMVNIVLSDGKWLMKWYNVGAVAIIGALASIVRHNGIFFTIPMAILLILLYRKATKNVYFTVAACVCVIFSIVYVIYPLANVRQNPSQVYVESVGVPMTILGSVRAITPEALDQQTAEFLSEIADDETWEEHFEFGNYNSIKFLASASREVAKVPPAELFFMTLRTMINAPKESLLGVIELTRIVWNPLDWDYEIYEASFPTRAKDTIWTEDEVEAMQPIKDISRDVYSQYILPTINLLTPSRILTTLGLHMLLLILAGVYSVNRNLGAKALFLLIPSLAHNFGTMLLLCGPDYRFFHFNTVITLPLVIVLLARRSRKHQR